MTKYGNRRVSFDGFTFDSQAESRRYGELLLLERAGEILCLRVHPSYCLQKGFRQNGKTYQPVTYVLDFSYFEGAQLVCEDVKGFATSDFKIKEKLFRFQHPEIVLRIVKA